MGKATINLKNFSKICDRPSTHPIEISSNPYTERPRWPALYQTVVTPFAARFHNYSVPAALWLASKQPSDQPEHQ